jgi:DNA-binding CsgD family transcriptional regulator
MTATDLTPRELEVVALVADGMTNKRIAARLGIAHNTVRVHVASVAFKLGFHGGVYEERVVIARWWWSRSQSQAA